MVKSPLPDRLRQEDLLHPEEGVELGPIKLQYPIGLGCWQFGDAEVWGYQTYDKALTKQSIMEAMEASADCGINFFDTAEVYGKGRSEEFVGQFVKSYPTGMAGFDKIVVATKYFPHYRRFKYPKSLLDAAEASLRRLCLTGPIDLYYIHGPIGWATIETLAAALGEAHKRGLIKAAAVSNFSAWEVRRAYLVLRVYGVPLACNQVEFSLLRTKPIRRALPFGQSLKSVRILAAVLGPVDGPNVRGTIPTGV
eukprot:scaffold2364_cov426-Prasinococcus_capsulatus_cf.AAC.15